MDFSLATFAALFLLFASASCAPAGLPLQDACGDVRNSSLALNHAAKNASIKARNGDKTTASFTGVAWMEATDMCDPETLKQDSTTCLHKIFRVLKSYNSTVEKVSRFESCSNFVVGVKSAMEDLLRDMSKCVKSRAGMIHEEESQASNQDSVQQWEETPLCHYTLDRLFSFSIFTARVFAVGDPAHHTDGSTKKCV